MRVPGYVIAGVLALPANGAERYEITVPEGVKLNVIHRKTDRSKTLTLTVNKSTVVRKVEAAPKPPVAAPVLGGSFSTTGSIVEGGNRLVVENPALFTLNDHVIVEIGKEPGKGIRGTKGVGGTWPAKSYSSVSAMRADSNAPPRLFAWAEDTGFVWWQLDPGNWVNFTNEAGAGSTFGGDQERYYLAKAVPLSLQAQVTGITGNTLTLNKAAAVSVTDATVYRDYAPIFTKQIAENQSVVLPAGDFPVGGTVYIDRKPGSTFAGSGKDKTRLFSPKGVPSAAIEAHFSPNTTIKDLTLQGNQGDTGFGLNWDGSTRPGSGGRGVTEYETPQASTFPRAIFFNQGSNDSVAQDLRVLDAFVMAVGVAFADRVWAHRIENVQNNVLRQYIQWQFQWTDTTGGGCVDCSVKAKYTSAGFEAFKATNVQFIRPKAVNASMAMNGSGGWLIEDAELRFKPGMVPAGVDKYIGADVIAVNINTNIGVTPQVSLGGTIRNITIINEGYIDDKGNVASGVRAPRSNPNIKVLNLKYYAPPHQATSKFWPYGLWLDGPGSSADGVVSITGGNPFGQYAWNVFVGALTNCVADYPAYPFNVCRAPTAADAAFAQ